MNKTPRRSQRLKNHSSPEHTIQPKQEALDKSNESTATKPTPKILELATETRLLIYTYLVLSERPFMIGRIQDTPQRPHHGSPRDIFSTMNNGRSVERNEEPNRPIQPAISRVCRTLREEVLPVFYGENQFWLIHNEFEPEGYQQSHQEANDRLPRNFEPWLDQTPAAMFKYMQHVALCGYTFWPNRAMIRVNLKARTMTQVKEYSTYGDELDLGLTMGDAWVDGVRKALTEHPDEEDAKEVLKKVLSKADFLFCIPREHVSAPPGLSRTKQPKAGWEFDW